MSLLCECFSKSVLTARLKEVAPAIALIAAVVMISHPARALGDDPIVVSHAEKRSLRLVKSGVASPIVDDSQDYPGVLRAVLDLQADMERVSGVKPMVLNSMKSPIEEVILVGTVGRNRQIDELIKEKKIDVNEIKGKWESTLTQTVENPFPGVKRGLVIAGSDKRGTIYGIYTLAEQIGVSPWYWWADVPPQHHQELYVKAGRWVEGESAVKYRGIFLNDEAPALTGWAKEKFGGLNHEFYAHVFELLLRLKANYLWPAMWSNAFNEDDPLNPILADEYGIVMGTSHHEPMLRAQQEWKRHGTGPWNYETNSAELDKFWEEGIARNKDLESTVTVGMRGDGDMPMSEGADIALLEKVVADQLSILRKYSTPTLDADLKVWALYKEVQDYYEKGMRVPENITLLWSDDNWGNIRRLPTSDERLRPGGAGIYYHFDYVGGPRNYKWINTNALPRIWEQMHLAKNYGADRIWIVNVGDLKPMEFPMEFFLAYARHPERWGKDDLMRFTEQWSAREFGQTYAIEASSIFMRYMQLISRRKPELLDPDTYSQTSYGEADRVSAEWEALVVRAQKVYDRLPENERDAFFELILHPVKAAAIVNELYIAVGKNRLYQSQGRVSANDWADKAEMLFKADAELSDEYNHKLAHGKWDHMMDQVHIGYTFWNDPPKNIMPEVRRVNAVSGAKMGVAIEWTTQQGAEVTLPPIDRFDPVAPYIDVFNGGDKPFQMNASADRKWIKLSQSAAAVTKDVRLFVEIDWNSAPAGEGDGAITITDGGNSHVLVHVATRNPSPDQRSKMKGFVELNNYVSIEAEHSMASDPVGNVSWQRIPYFGQTLSGMTAFPVTAQSFEKQPSPTLEYETYLSHQGVYNVDLRIAPTMNFVPGRGLRIGISVDQGPSEMVEIIKANSIGEWNKAVADEIRHAQATISVESPGVHILKIHMVDPGVVLEKIVIRHGDILPSYLGPPESPFLK